MAFGGWQAFLITMALFVLPVTFVCLKWVMRRSIRKDSETLQIHARMAEIRAHLGIRREVSCAILVVGASSVPAGLRLSRLAIMVAERQLTVQCVCAGWLPALGGNAHVVADPALR
jgi:hypothetical protein